MQSWEMFGRNGAMILESSKTELYMPYISFPEKHPYVARLLNVFVLLKNVSRLSDQIEF